MTVTFNTPLRHNEISGFRGAVIAAAGTQNTLFHNHQEQGFEYHYPLIQYRTIGGCAAIVAINDGIEQMLALLGAGFVGSNIRVGAQIKESVAINNIKQNEYLMRCLEQPIKYHISRWLPLNQKNYKLWREIETEEDKIEKLKSILIGNVISMAKGIGWQVEQRIDCVIDAQSVVVRQIKYKNEVLMAFSLDFAINVFLPIGIGIGKGVAANHGVIQRPFDKPL